MARGLTKHNSADRPRSPQSRSSTAGAATGLNSQAPTDIIEASRFAPGQILRLKLDGSETATIVEVTATDHPPTHPGSSAYTVKVISTGETRTIDLERDCASWFFADAPGRISCKAGARLWSDHNAPTGPVSAAGTVDIQLAAWRRKSSGAAPPNAGLAILFQPSREEVEHAAGLDSNSSNGNKQSCTVALVLGQRDCGSSANSTKSTADSTAVVGSAEWIPPTRSGNAVIVSGRWAWTFPDDGQWYDGTTMFSTDTLTITATFEVAHQGARPERKNFTPAALAYAGAPGTRVALPPNVLGTSARHGTICGAPREDGTYTIRIDNGAEEVVDPRPYNTIPAPVYRYQPGTKLLMYKAATSEQPAAWVDGTVERFLGLATGNRHRLSGGLCGDIDLNCFNHTTTHRHCPSAQAFNTTCGAYLANILTDNATVQDAITGKRLKVADQLVVQHEQGRDV